MNKLQSFEKTVYNLLGKDFTVYRKGEGPPVIIMHELPGMGEACLDFADRLVEARFRVFLPLLFGTAGKITTNANFREVCISKEFYVLKKNQTSPIVEKLRALCKQIYTEHPGKGVGAIGMCLTGGFAIPMLLEPSLVAPVISQPAMPFLSGNLGVSKEELENVKMRVREENIPIRGYRFRRDLTAPKSKINTLENTFPDHYKHTWVKNHRRFCHAVFTGDYIPKNAKAPTPSTKEALNSLISFFNDRLR